MLASMTESSTTAEFISAHAILELQSQWPDDLEESVQHHLRILDWTHCTIDIIILQMTASMQCKAFDAERYRQRQSQLVWVDDSERVRSAIGRYTEACI